MWSCRHVPDKSRLREEVVSQGIELQRRWLRSIKTQVETERGGRLAKLDTLTTSLKQLERITLDNSSQLDDNVRLHKVWSALRAVQSKTESGDIAFDDELRVLKSTSMPLSGDASTTASDSVISATLGQLEKSGIAQTGVKSLAALSSWFSNSVAPRIHSASLVPAPHEATILSHLASAGLSRVMFRPKPGVVEGGDVGSVLARAEWCLGEKDLDGATREVNSLKGWPGRLAADWLKEARRKLEVQQALDVRGLSCSRSARLIYFDALGRGNGSDFEFVALGVKNTKDTIPGHQKCRGQVVHAREIFLRRAELFTQIHTQAHRNTHGSL